MKQSIIFHVEHLLGIKLNHPRLVETAFQHTSYVNEAHNSKLVSNERLEFLGDAVLELVVSAFLYHEYPNDPEGKLTRLRAQLVCEPSLAYLARSVHFDDYIRLGKGELATGGKQRDSIISDCFEAFLGAIYLDQGLECVQTWLFDLMLKNHRQLLTQVNQDYKTLFQERVQQKGSVNIQYQVENQEGPAHDQLFTVGLYVNQVLLAKGQGRSKKIAEMKAAQTALNFVDEKGNYHVSSQN
ncbi:ribonuclease III [Vaginisenegalia massiliensis]|uniref:ribonuclease III n=1 Tax=Vaginisenegalia massiliensis TaxID=2058294 RepID=UPI000F542A18|nr:ribonuclease III [Vaginisenegalia massiliensis]